jgi:hypothetical protein
VRSLLKLTTMRDAGIAAVVTAGACYPRLFLWMNRPELAAFLVSILLMSAFLLWSFVLAWHREGTGKRVFGLPRSPWPWVAATLAGACAAALLYFFLDPITRQIHPAQFPKDLQGWAAHLLFALGFEQLFVCFAPFAFFIRLSRRLDVSCVLTVLFGIFIVWLQISDKGASAVLMLALLASRAFSASLTLYFYLRGGVWLVLWWVLLLNARHLWKVL